jgi:hypothetical protein
VSGKKTNESELIDEASKAYDVVRTMVRCYLWDQSEGYLCSVQTATGVETA